jgi:hypothetical protein
MTALTSTAAHRLESSLIVRDDNDLGPLHLSVTPLSARFESWASDTNLALLRLSLAALLSKLRFVPAAAASTFLRGCL